MSLAILPLHFPPNTDISRLLPLCTPLGDEALDKTSKPNTRLFAFVCFSKSRSSIDCQRLPKRYRMTVMPRTLWLYIYILIPSLYNLQVYSFAVFLRRSRLKFQSLTCFLFSHLFFFLLLFNSRSRDSSLSLFPSSEQSISF